MKKQFYRVMGLTAYCTGLELLIAVWNIKTSEVNGLLAFIGLMVLGFFAMLIIAFSFKLFEEADSDY